MSYLVLALLTLAPVVLFLITNRAYKRTVEEAALDSDDEVPKPPATFETKSALPMAFLVIAFLTVLAAMLPTPSRNNPDDVHVQWALLPLLLGIWGVFLLDALVGIILHWRRWNVKRKLLALAGGVVPPLRLIPEHSAVPGLRYVPFAGWEITSKQLLLRLERAFSGPMMVAALFIIPIVAVDYLWQGNIQDHSPLDYATDFGTQAIWLLFAIEFFVLVAAAPKKAAYCKSHWLDLAIVLLPLIYFMRFLRVFRVGRVARVVRIQKMSRIYRLRGLMLRLLRTFIVLQLADRMGGWATKKRLNVLKNKLRVMEEEMEEVKGEIDRIESFLAELERDEGQSEEAVATSERPSS